MDDQNKTDTPQPEAPQPETPAQAEITGDDNVAEEGPAPGSLEHAHARLDALQALYDKLVLQLRGLTH